MHDVVIVAVPLIAILAGILLNRADAKELRKEIAEMRSEVRREIAETRSGLEKEISATRVELLARITSIKADLRQFYHLTGKLEARIDAIEKRP